MGQVNTKIPRKMIEVPRLFFATVIVNQVVVLVAAVTCGYDSKLSARTDARVQHADLLQVHPRAELNSYKCNQYGAEGARQEPQTGPGRQGDRDGTIIQNGVNGIPTSLAHVGRFARGMTHTSRVGVPGKHAGSFCY